MPEHLTIRQVISEVKEDFRKINADAWLPNKYVYNIILKHTSYFVRQMSDAFRILRVNSIYQSYKCVPMEEAPTIDDCCGLRGKCTIYRTKDRIPDLFEDSLGAIIQTVKSIDHSKSLTRTTPDAWLDKMKNPWNKTNKDEYYFYYNNRVYTPITNWRKVEIFGYFQEDISDINLCDDCTDHPTKECRRFMDKRIMVTKDMWRVISEMVIKDLATIYARITPDVNPNKNETK